MEIRRAVREDIPAITRIFNEGIEDRIATLDIFPTTEEERLRWLTQRLPRHPVLVACQQDQVVGWFSLNPFSPRYCYDWVGDISLYVGRQHRGQGIGKALLKEGSRLAQELGYYKLVLTVFDFNEAAIRCYVKAGFTMAGTYHQHGYYMGKLTNILLMEKLLPYQHNRLVEYYRNTYGIKPWEEEERP